MALSTAADALPLFYTTGLSTSAAEIWSGPTTAQRAHVTAVYVANVSTADVGAYVIHRWTSGGADVYPVPGATIEANKSIILGPLILSSTSSQQSIRGYANSASAIQVFGYGYLETI